MIPPALAAQFSEGSEVAFADFVELALYDPTDGFYATGGRAGRRADFLTSPEVGPLFGALVAHWLDDTWERLGRPDPFVVVEAGAGPGTLARSVRVAEPASLGSLAYVLVERSASQRALHADHLPGRVGDLSGEGLVSFCSTPRAGHGAAFASSAELPSVIVGAVVANELLDNVAFDVVRLVGAGVAAERLVVVAGIDGDELDLAVEPVDVTVAEMLARLSVPIGVWVPWQTAARHWLNDVIARIERGRLLVLDYGASTAELAKRAEMGWLRTFRGHERGGHPLDNPGTQDITSDVAVDQLQLDRPADRLRSQRELLDDLGIDELVAEGRRLWEERAHAPDLEALRARSRVREAEALTDPDGLGAFLALEWDVRLP
jgi:SAM-dependent MidA family methyltransferase